MSSCHLGHDQARLLYNSSDDVVIALNVLSEDCVLGMIMRLLSKYSDRVVS